ncbi:pseudouridine synthase [Urechidicola sp. KH5]
MQVHRHFIIYKPDGYLSQFINNQTKRSKKKLLGELYEFPEGTMAIGRLDEPSEGLLFLTTSGKVSELVRSNKFEKEYWVQLDGVITDEAINFLKTEVTITVEGNPYTTKALVAEQIETPTHLPKRRKKIRDDRHGPTSWVKIVLTEGKFRQVRKMTAAVGFPTLRLVRYRIGNTTIEDLNTNTVCEVIKFKI